MAAVIDLRTGRQLESVPDLAAPVAAPTLRLIEGGSSPRAVRQRRIYLRRRILVLTVAVVVVLALAQGASAAFSALAPSGPTPSGSTYTVGAGDTLWEVAGRVAPSVDRRQMVDDLVALNGSAPIRVGQTLVLPRTAG